MTYREKEQQLRKNAESKLKMYTDISKDLEHGGFTQYSIFDLKNALDAHTNAQNEHGKFISDMIKGNYSMNDEYLLQ